MAIRNAVGAYAETEEGQGLIQTVSEYGESLFQMTKRVVINIGENLTPSNGMVYVH